MANSWHVVHKRVRVGETALGKAVFAIRRFQKDQVIGVIQGAVIDDPEYGSSYCMDLGNDRSLEPIAPFRYLNHSCDPNAEIFSFTYGPYSSDRPNQLFLQALRPIKPGDEITIDYAWTADCAIPCLCGSTKCRGWVVDEAELAIIPPPSVQPPAAATLEPALDSTAG
jgi:hypothetical protein